ncbi:SMI1/KNR4 family protein [Plasticicumulans acidivorans]|uniref:SMI1/KNR4 family protein n=1 Tax=Plasticicumulans acidivorans TaxID=886464 RepID=UPI000D710510|nr:SMI1/KNR4 family protein [Plasticicumulans acidivorans]
MNFVLNGKDYEVLVHGHPLSEEELCAFEAQIHIRLPPQLRSYYLKWNGGLACPSDLPEGSSVWVKLQWPVKILNADLDQATSVRKFFIINAQGETDFFSIWSAYEKHIPKGYLCFSQDPVGSLFLISTQERSLGQIFFWPRQFGGGLDGDDSRTETELAFIVGSVTEFLLLMREEPNNDEPLEDWVKRMYPE